MQLVRLLSEDVVKAPLEAYDKEEAIAELVELLVRAVRVQDRDEILDVLYGREAKGTTGIGGGVAIPHARHEDLSGLRLAAGVSPDGIEFEAIDDKPVHVVFLVIAEAHDPGPNVEVLADIGNLFQRPGAYEKLRVAPSAHAFIRTIDELELEQDQ